MRQKKPLTSCEKYGHSWSGVTTSDGWQKCMRHSCQAALPPAHLQHKGTEGVSTVSAAPLPSINQSRLFD